VREWYANGPLGVEQGFDVVSRPAGRGVVRLAIGALPAWLAVTSGGLSITVDDRGARYPVRVDPLIQPGSKLVGTGPTGAVEQGFRVALSSDGNTALIGSPSDNGDAGAAWVFTRAGGVWSQQGSKLNGSGVGFPPITARRGIMRDRRFRKRRQIDGHR
jgi:hypothetical protein